MEDTIRNIPIDLLDDHPDNRPTRILPINQVSPDPNSQCPISDPIIKTIVDIYKKNGDSNVAHTMFEWVLLSNDDWLARNGLGDPMHGRLWEKVIETRDLNLLTPVAAFKGIFYVNNAVKEWFENICGGTMYAPIFDKDEFGRDILLALVNKHPLKAGWRRIYPDGSYLSLNGEQIGKDTRFVGKDKGAQKAGKRQQCTYFIQSGTGGPIKIGTTERDPNMRLQALQCGSPNKLNLLGFSAQIGEQETHRKFEHLHIQGEWYRATPELLDYIEEKTNE